jgi:U3 small nucleolar RNA-associated protein 22
MFKATLQFLAKHNLSKTPYVFQAQDITLPKSALAPMFFDGPRNLNILYKMTPWSYSHLQTEAKSTVDMLRDSLADHFESTFILRTSLLTYQYDAIMEFPLSAFGLDPSGDDYEYAVLEKCRKLHGTLAKALTDRITALALLTPDEGSWSVDSARPQEDQGKSVLVGLTTDPANATRTVDLGPPAENKKEAASFRQFWGEKAELRRFKDGSILESVVWSLKDTPMSVIEQIVRYITRKHVGGEVAEQAKFSVDSFGHLIPSSRVQGQSGTSAFSARMVALAGLEKDIRGLEGLPLSIRLINAADAQLRYSALDAESLKTPASIIVQFEGSARWPDDLCAIQRTKIAFLLKLSDLLSEDKPSYVTRVGLENTSFPSQNQAYLDIILPSGFSFRLRIHHDREATLLDRQLKDKSLDNQSRESAGTALATYRRDYLQRPAHTQALQTLCTRYPALSPSIRLTKRWFAAHLLTPHFSEELVELLVVRTFLQPYPWAVPSTATTGFLRTIMWISRWDWRHVPLIVDYSSSSSAKGGFDNQGMSTGSLSPEDIKKVQTRFEAWRRIDPAMNRVVLFAATNLDTDGTTWSDRGKPERVVAARMTSLARITTEAIRAQEDKLVARLQGGEQDIGSAGLVPESLFVSQLQDYNIIIRLSTKFAQPSKKKTDAKFKNLEMQQGPLAAEDKHNVGYDPAALLADDLRQIYGDAVLWFWNPEATDVIAGLWNPVVTAQRSWKVKAGWNSVPVPGEKKKEKNKGEQDAEDDDVPAVDIQLNKEAVCSEIRRLGGELIAGIELNG